MNVGLFFIIVLEVPIPDELVLWSWPGVRRHTRKGLEHVLGKANQFIARK
jgi:hypothetical protein